MKAVGTKTRDKIVNILKCRKGSNAVEFALVMPVFVLMIFGLIGYGYYLGASHSLAQLAAEGARSALAGLDAEERRSIGEELVERSVVDFPMLDPDRLTVSTTEADASFKMTLRYDTDGFPVWNLGLDLIFPNKTIERSAVAAVASF